MVGVTWTEEEEMFLKYLFAKIPLNCKKYSKFKKIHEQFIANGYDKTQKAIERKSFRLGLKNYEVKEGYIEVVCTNKGCSNKVLIPKRFKGKNHYCDKCSEEKRRAWSKSEKGKAYHREYMKKWRQSKKLK